MASSRRWSWRRTGLCTACWTGDYPVPVQLPFEAVSIKFALETVGR